MRAAYIAPVFKPSIQMCYQCIFGNKMKTINIPKKSVSVVYVNKNENN